MQDDHSITVQHWIWEAYQSITGMKNPSTYMRGVLAQDLARRSDSSNGDNQTEKVTPVTLRESDRFTVIASEYGYKCKLDKKRHGIDADMAFATTVKDGVRRSYKLCPDHVEDEVFKAFPELIEEVN